MQTTHGTVHWNELNTRDPEAACAWYAALLGWAFEEHPMPDGGLYRTAILGGKPVAGVFELPPGPEFEGIPPHWFTYFAVDDVAATIARFAELGGALRREPFDVPGVGTFAVVEDPSGAVSAFIQPAVCG